jgi:CBS domain-containing protein
MFTELHGRAVVDRAGRHARLTDLAVDLWGGEYPPVSVFLVEYGRPRSSRRLIYQEDVDEIGNPIRVRDLAAAPCQSEDGLEELDLLKRDVLDALVLDLDRQRTVRVNDLWLRLEDPLSDGGGRLVVGGVDASARAILRRLAGRWRFARRPGSGSVGQLIDWSDVEILLGDPRRTFPSEDMQPHVARLQPARIADLAEALPYLHAAELLNLLDIGLAADVFEFIDPVRQVQVIGELDEDRAAALLAEAAPDRATDALGRLPLAEARRLLERLPRERAMLIVELLRYPANTAGGIMTNDVVVVPADLTVAGAIEHIRPRLAHPDLVYYVYVVADLESRTLEGIVTLRDLLVSRPDEAITDVMNRTLVMATPHEPARDVAYRLADHQLNALPVVDRDRRLLGVVTIDNAIVQMAPDALRQSLPRVFT